MYRFIQHKNIFLGTLSFIVGAVFFGAYPFSAAAFFTGDAHAIGNNFEAGALTLESIVPTTSELTVSSAADDEFIFSVSTNGLLEEQYKITAAKGNNCTPGFWNGLSVTATADTLQYEGFLSTLLATSTTGGNWTLLVTATSSLQAAKDETCNFMVEVTAWQDEFTSETGGGFSDTTSFEIIVTADEDFGPQQTTSVVLNEIYPNPDSSLSAPNDMEWVELYNGTPSPIDVEGWSLGENSSTSTEQLHVISAFHTCADGVKVGYARPYNNASTIIPAGGFLLIEFCAASRLNNEGDTVSLYDGTNTQKDIHSYPATVKGKSHARIPDGSVWVDPVPTPGTPNSATEEELKAAGWSESEIMTVLAEMNSKPALTAESGVSFEVIETVDFVSAPSHLDAEEEANRREANAAVDETENEPEEDQEETPYKEDEATTPDEVVAREEAVEVKNEGTQEKEEEIENEIARLDEETTEPVEEVSDETVKENTTEAEVASKEETYPPTGEATETK